MKEKRTLYLYLGIIILILVGCNSKKEDISLEIWHYYNGAQKLAFDESVNEFNETVGLEKGIIIEAYSQGNIEQLEEKIIQSTNKELEFIDMPDMVTVYSETALNLDNKQLVTNLEEYLTNGEIEEYMESYIEEGRLGNNEELKIFPTAKSTEVLMLNKTDWDKFAEATDVSMEDLSTWEGIREIGELYYNWTKSLSEDGKIGKAFFGRDALANYILVGSKQLGEEIFQIEENRLKVKLDYDDMKRIWENYYIPYISGYYTSYGNFSSDDAKIGRIIALVGSTTGATYFPENVTIDNNDSYPIELVTLPLPNFKDTDLTAVQQGAGIVVIKSTEEKERAAIEFLKWFTEDERNLEFSIKTGYLPVKKSAYNRKEIIDNLECEASKELVDKSKCVIPLAMDQMEKYELYFSTAFENGFETREFIASELENKSKADRERVIQLIEEGLSHKEAVDQFASKEKFDEWFEEFKEKLLRLVIDEK